ncbi:toprim domain-containing protein [Faecalicoccus acidiformans]|uniref:Toprim domain-containing protein n=1 Tax=Faecalicoccus acidiformans TaxID=915173 RepID=A0ABS2FQX8_9FIRM|nr:toprim domain-containing protein [Faecalicoccus acidiformans]MBM6831945.1 toprim domain-containing protein [Faecalicoccus acidiformans]
MEQFLRDFPEVNSIVLHLDNDRAGRLATKTIQNMSGILHQSMEKM